MKEVKISSTSKGLVKASGVINKIQEVENNYNLSKEKAKTLYEDLENVSTSIQETSSKWYKLGGYSTSDLYKLIQESHKSTLNTSKSIYNLVDNNNENTKLLSEMIRALAMLSGLSFEKISENSTELEQLSEQLKIGSNQTGQNSSDINQVLVHTVDKALKEKKRQENIDYNFGIINENLKELQKEFNTHKKENETKFKELKKLYKTSSEKHFLKVLKRQKIAIYTLFSLLIIGFITIGYLLLIR